MNCTLKPKRLVHLFGVVFLTAVIPLFSAKADQPNIILIGIDTLRADHLKCYGYQRNTSPNIDTLAAEGVLFKNALSHIPLTPPSFATIFTSKLPVSHGVLGLDKKLHRLEDRHLTLAEILRDRGYFSAAFVSTALLKKSTNLHQGFKLYNDKGFIDEIDARTVNKKVLPWLENHKDDKFFLFIHYYDPHGPYTPPEPYSEEFDYTTDSSEGIRRMPMYQRQGNIFDPSYFVAHYDGEIRYTDHEVGRVLKKIEELGLEKKTLIVIVSDHGEAMHERSWWFDHSLFLYDEQLHVPLIFWYPKMFDNVEIDNMVGLVDVMPTVLDILGIKFPKDIEGESLLSLLKGRNKVNRFIYSETAFGEASEDSGTTMSTKDKRFAIRTSQWKLIKSPKSTKENYELYFLKNDPKELNNLAGRNYPAEKELREELEEFINTYKTSPYYLKTMRFRFQKNTEDKDRTKALKSLGYT